MTSPFPDPILPDVALVHWPLDEDTRRLLQAAGLPRLLLVAPGEVPPVDTDELEDWVRSPVDTEELELRRLALAQRCADISRVPEPVVTLDDDGVLRRDGRWVALTPLEHRVAVLLLDRRRQVVRRQPLATAAWPDGAPPGPRALDTVLQRLRRRVAPLGIRVNTVKGRGYLLSLDPPPSSRP